MKSLIFLCYLFASLASCKYSCIGQTKEYSAAIANNYDFVPADKIAFEDDFSIDTPGKFAHKWKPMKSGEGKGIIRNVGGKNIFDFVYGNGALAQPQFSPLPSTTIVATFECDFIVKDNKANFDVVFLFGPGGGLPDRMFGINYFGRMWEFYSRREDGFPNVSFPGKFDTTVWHHFAILFKQHEVKWYIDKNKVWSTQETKLDRGVNRKIDDIPTSFYINGRASMAFKNVKFAATDGIYAIEKPKESTSFNKIISGKKFVTHTILFDINKAIIKPQSIEFVRELAKWLKQNPLIKLEIDGHTDNVGSDADNLYLSLQRAEAVKNMLVSFGIDITRLRTKPYGASKPIDTNTTLDGKSNNRRVEFIKL